jgi:hypothetical protein
MKIFDRGAAAQVMGVLVFLSVGWSIDAFAGDFSIRGRVVDESRNPVKGAEVTFQFVNRPNRSLRVADRLLRTQTTRTDRHGVLTVQETNLPEVADLWLRSDVVADGYVDHQKETKVSKKRLGDGSTMKVVLTLTRGKPFSCQVVDPSGKPIVSAEVQVACRVPTFFCRPRKTDSQGRFRLWIPQDAQHLVAIVHSRNWAVEEHTIFTNSGKQKQISLRKGTRVIGRLVDARGRSMEGYWVVAESTRSDYPTVKVVATTKPNGSFDLGQLSGEFNISSPRWVKRWIPDVYLQSKRPPSRVALSTINTESMKHADRLLLKSTSSATISGRITDHLGNPVAGEIIAAHCNVAAGKSTVFLDYAITDENGHYDLQAIACGTEHVFVSPVYVRKVKRDVYLKSKVRPYVKFATARGRQVHHPKLTGDVSDVDFEYLPWTARDGFLKDIPDDLNKALKK